MLMPLKKVCVLSVASTVLILAFGILAYSPHYTHPDLTTEMVKLHNSVSVRKIDDKFIPWLRQGSIDEDTDPRWINHFYDPQSGEGWTGEHLGPHEKELVQSVSQKIIAIGFTPLPAWRWATDQKAQNLFINYGWNHTWQKAIYDYVNGNEERAFESLGYVLHLIEDMSVPDHTRNDSHPHVAGDPGSPYEDWSKNYTNSYKLDTAENLINDRTPIPKFLNLKEAFDYVAKYSNENFFSEETIIDTRYVYPKHDYEQFFGGTKLYYKSDSSGDYILAKRIENEKGELIYTTNDVGILSAYFSRLSRRSVLAGAGVINLFFREVEGAKQNPSLLEAPPPPNSLGTIGTIFYTRVISPLGEVTGLIKPLQETASRVANWFSNQRNKFKESVFNTASVLYGSSVTAEDLEVSPPAGGETSTNTPQAQPEVRPLTILTPADVLLPAGRETSANTPQSPEALPQTNAETSTTSTQPPALVPSPKPPPSSNTSSALPIAGVGGAPPVAEPSPVPPPSPPPDTTPPDVSLTINECGQTLATNGCLVATTTLNLSWLSAASDLDYYELTINGTISATTSTSTVITATDNATTTLSVRAKDKTGNWSESQTQNVEVATLPLVINEIAWMGTSADRSEDEWIELYNPTGKTVNLSGWTLHSITNNTPYISLAGSIAAGGFFLLERTDDTTVSDISANQIYTGSLINSGEALELSKASTTIDKTPAVSACSGWCGGEDNPYYYSMERYDPLASGENSSNWGDWPSFLANGKNADNANINGTPGKRNSINYYIDKSGTSLAASKTIKKSSSPYLIPSAGFTISSGKILAIEPGVVVKFMGPGGPPFLKVDGVLKAEGTAADKIIFTSYRDDTYAGDTNQDATSTSPAGGDWGSIKITADGSIFDYTVVRYGGVEDSNENYWANIRVENASVTIKNSTIEKAKDHGVWLRGGSGTIENNIFRENNRNEGGQTPGTGLMLSATSSPTISNNQFIQNNKGLVIEANSTSTVSNNSFTGQINYAVESNGAYPTFSGNTVSGNGKNGILFQGAALKDHSLSANLPYIFQNTTYTVAAGKTLTIPAGTIIKLEGTGNILVKGRIAASGAASQKIIFTSLHDDDCGISGGCGDTNGTTTVAAAGDWDNITFTSDASATSTLEYFTIRYGGNSDSPIFNPPRGALRLIGSSHEIKNGTIEKNYIAGIWMQNSTSTLISNLLIQDHTEPATETAYGIYLTASSTPTVSGTTFKNNETDIFTDGTSSYTDGGGNTFE